MSILKDEIIKNGQHTSLISKNRDEAVAKAKLYLAFAEGKILQKLESVGFLLNKCTDLELKWRDFNSELCPVIMSSDLWRIKPVTRVIRLDELPFTFALYNKVPEGILLPDRNHCKEGIIKDFIDLDTLKYYAKHNYLWSVDGKEFHSFTIEELN